MTVITLRTATTISSSSKVKPLAFMMETLKCNELFKKGGYSVGFEPTTSHAKSDNHPHVQLNTSNNLENDVLAL